MNKHIKIVVTEFYANNGIDVNGKFYNEDGTPIMSRYGVDMDGEEYHLGQISSSFGWAKSDCGYERYKAHLDKLYPEAEGNFTFEYEFVTMRMLEDKKNDELFENLSGELSGLLEQRERESCLYGWVKNKPEVNTDMFSRLLPILETQITGAKSEI